MPGFPARYFKRGMGNAIKAGPANFMRRVGSPVASWFFREGHFKGTEVSNTAQFFLGSVRYCQAEVVNAEGVIFGRRVSRSVAEQSKAGSDAASVRAASPWGSITPLQK